MHLKKLIVVAVFGLAGLAAFAGTCTVTRISLVETDGTHDTFGGQIDNGSGVDILNHNFLVAFLDANNNLVETKTVPGCLRSLQDGTSDFFSATSTEASSNTKVGLARLAFDSGFKVGGVADGDVSLSDIVVNRNNETLSITGKIKNNDNDKLVDPAVCIVVRDSADNVLITGKDTSIADLDENDTDTFSVAITVPDDNTADTVDVWADGLDGSSTDAPIAPASDLNNAVTECVATSTATKTPTTTPTATGTPAPTDTPAATNTATNTPAASNTPAATNTPC